MVVAIIPTLCVVVYYHRLEVHRLLEGGLFSNRSVSLCVSHTMEHGHTNVISKISGEPLGLFRPNFVYMFFDILYTMG